MQVLDKNSFMFSQLRESIQLYTSFNTTQSRENIAARIENRFRSYASENTGHSYISLDEEMSKILAPVQFIWGKLGRFAFYGAGFFILSIYFFLPDNSQILPQVAVIIASIYYFCLYHKCLAPDLQSFCREINVAKNKIEKEVLINHVILPVNKEISIVQTKLKKLQSFVVDNDRICNQEIKNESLLINKKINKIEGNIFQITRETNVLSTAAEQFSSDIISIKNKIEDFQIEGTPMAIKRKRENYGTAKLVLSIHLIKSLSAIKGGVNLKKRLSENDLKMLASEANCTQETILRHKDYFKNIQSFMEQTPGQLKMVRTKLQELFDTNPYKNARFLLNTRILLSEIDKKISKN